MVADLEQIGLQTRAVGADQLGFLEVLRIAGQEHRALSVCKIRKTSELSLASR